MCLVLWVRFWKFVVGTNSLASQPITIVVVSRHKLDSLIPKS